MAVAVTDTHPLLWYTAGRHRRLSRGALRLFTAADRDQGLIHVPAVVIWEIGLLARAGRISISERIDRWADALVAKRGFSLAPLDPEVVAIATSLEIIADPFDLAIAATAIAKGLPLITGDERIAASGLVEIAW